jgi:hypothetical protein
MHAVLPCLVALLAPGAATDPDAYDPILDGGEATPLVSDEPEAKPDPRMPGFVLTGNAGLYGGAVRSFLTKDLSRLEGGLRPGVGIGIGVRTRSPIEVGLDVMLGLGRSYEADVEAEVAAYDLLLEPRILWHFADPAPWGGYAGLAGSAWLFDIEAAGLSQAGFGPGAIVGAAHRPHPRDAGLLFVELGLTALHDFLAFELIEPTAEALAEDPTAGPTREEGAWYLVGRLMVGYRLTGF